MDKSPCPRPHPTVRTLCTQSIRDKHNSSIYGDLFSILTTSKDSITMKRTYDYSFIQADNSPSIPTIPTRSLRQMPTMLATQAMYAPAGYMINAAPNGPSAFTTKEPIHPTHHLQQYRIWDEDQDLQSNMWMTTSAQHTGSTRMPWGRSFAQISVSSPPPRPPLAGLGISFGNPDTGNLLLPRYTQDPATQSSSEFSRFGGSPAATPSRKRKASALDEDENVPTAAKSPSNEQDGAAYSACPSAEYAAPSPPSVAMHYSDFSPFVPYSPADDMLMFINTTPIPDEMNDFPVRSPGQTPLHGTPNLLAIPQTYNGRELGEDTGSPMVGLVVDVNYRNLAMTQSPALCINPADIGGVTEPQVKIEDSEMQIDTPMVTVDPGSTTGTTSISRMPTPDMNTEFPEEALTAVVSVLADSVKREAFETTAMGSVPQGFISPQPPTYPTRSGLGLGLQFAAPPPRRIVTSGPMAIPVVSPMGPTGPRVPLAPIMNTIGGVALNRLPPIQNAYEGVDIEELRLRAERFRQLNPGCELDKDFLQMFAGRFDKTGQQITEFRCYVKDCNQTNKRRDHILVHVGSHVEHRPFQCPQW